MSAEIIERRKDNAGSTAMVLWIGIGIYLFAVTEKALFISWQAGVFFVVGMFAASLIFGMLNYYTQRLLSASMAGIFGRETKPHAIMFQLFGTILVIGQGVLMYFLEDWIIQTLLFK